MAAAVAIAPISAERSLRPVVLVTGGSRGIGLALAHGFAARGHDVVLVARDAERLQRTASAIAAAHGVSADHIACDLAEPHAVADLMTAVADAGCRVDILVNCAGVGTSGAFTGNDAAGMRAALRLNMDAATALMHACLPGMVARGRGGVLNVASLAGMLPMPYLALYGATKSYLVAASRAVASELAGTGVTVSVLLPGPVDTGFFAHNMQSDEQRTGLLPGLSPEAVARTAIDGFLARQTVITPGMLAWLTPARPEGAAAAHAGGVRPLRSARRARRRGGRCRCTRAGRTAPTSAAAARARRPRPHPRARLHRGDARAAGRPRHAQSAARRFWSALGHRRCRQPSRARGLRRRVRGRRYRAAGSRTLPCTRLSGLRGRRRAARSEPGRHHPLPRRGPGRLRARQPVSCAHLPASVAGPACACTCMSCGLGAVGLPRNCRPGDAH